MPDAYWNEDQFESLLDKFPEEQVVIKVSHQIAGCALSIIVDYDQFESNPTCKEITADYTFNSHNNHASVLYEIDVFIQPEFRGLRLGRRL